MAADEPYGPGDGATLSAALVTGGAKRIGRAIALTLARNGWKVAVHFHGSAAAAANLVDEITKAGGTAMALQADLSREAEVRTLLPAVEQALG
ncbi:MAG: SDR family NAD(P)-dependent oxidoreductase, partial [Bradyrhizobium sp.]